VSLRPFRTIGRLYPSAQYNALPISNKSALERGLISSDATLRVAYARCLASIV